ncbi:unnamed protein product [Citrullus colocynthis]|uniref:Uncharacterized protein n=1 Tax=Citrullus colocynthis TaxID=252529 RepID=A0ABP0ZEM2_9ROSI
MSYINVPKHRPSDCTLIIRIPKTFFGLFERFTILPRGMMMGFRDSRGIRGSSNSPHNPKGIHLMTWLNRPGQQSSIAIKKSSPNFAHSTLENHINPCQLLYLHHHHHHQRRPSGREMNFPATDSSKSAHTLRISDHRRHVFHEKL